MPRALNTGTCIQQGDLFYSAGLQQEPVLATANAGKTKTKTKNTGEVLKKMQVNEPKG